MTSSSSTAVRLRDLRETGFVGQINALGAFVAFTAIGFALPDVLELVASGGIMALAVAVYTVTLLAGGLVCLFVVDQELREVSA